MSDLYNEFSNVALACLIPFGVPNNDLKKLDQLNIHMYEIFEEELPNRFIYQTRDQRLLRAIEDVKKLGTSLTDVEEDTIALMIPFGLSLETYYKITNVTGSHFSDLLDYVDDQGDDLKVFRVIAKILKEFRPWYISTGHLYLNTEFKSKLDLRGVLHDIQVTIEFTDEKNLKTYTNTSTGDIGYSNTLSDFLLTTFSNKDILLARLHGKTIHNIAEETGYSVQQIWQKLFEMVHPLPVFDDVNTFYDVLSEYDYEENEFERKFGRESLIYYRYIRFLQGVIGKKLPITGSAEELGIKKNQKNNSGEVLEEEFDSAENTQYSNIEDVFVDILRSHPQRFFTKESLLEALSNKINVERLPFKILDWNEQQLSKLPIIQEAENQFRYFDVSDINQHVIEMATTLDLAQGIYAADFFFNKYTSFFREIGIYSKTVMLDIMTKIKFSNTDRTFKMDSEDQIWIDIQTKRGFYLRQIAKFDGEKSEKLFEYIHANFGQKKSEIKGYLQFEFKEFFFNGRVCYISEESESPKFYTDAKQTLDAPIYLTDKAVKILKSLDRSVTIDNQKIERIGFREIGLFIVQKKFKSQAEAIDLLLLKNKILHLDDFSQVELDTFRSRITLLEKKHELLLISPGKYLAYHKFAESGFTKMNLEIFIDHVKNYAPSETFFTLQSLVKTGFSDELQKLGFADAFYERLIFTDSQIKKVPGEINIFINYLDNDAASPKLWMFIRQVMENQAISVDELQSKVYQEYGFKMDRDKIIERVCESPLVYQNELEMIYPDKKSMLADVYKTMGEMEYD